MPGLPDVVLPLLERDALLLISSAGAWLCIDMHMLPLGVQVALGQVLHQLDEFLPFGKSVPLDDLLAVALLVFFGVRTLQVRNALGTSCVCFGGSEGVSNVCALEAQ